jgi:nitric oxide dioxygenase
LRYFLPQAPWPGVTSPTAYGAGPEYPVVGFALLWTLEREPGDAWTREVADAWTAVYGVLSGHMIEQAYGRRPEAVE